MAVNECVVIAGLEQVHHTYGGGSVGIYWGQFSRGPIPEFMVLAHEREDNTIVFCAKPWILRELSGKRTRVDRPEDSLSDRMGALEKKLDSSVVARLQRDANLHMYRCQQCEDRLECLTKKVDIAIVEARTHRDLLSQRLDHTMSKVLVIEKELHRDDHHNINRLDKVVDDVRILLETVTGVAQKVHDAGKVLNT